MEAPPDGIAGLVCTCRSCRSGGSLSRDNVGVWLLETLWQPSDPDLASAQVGKVVGWMAPHPRRRAEGEAP